LPTQYPNGLIGLELWKLASASNPRGKGGAVSRFIVAHVLMIIAAFQERGDSSSARQRTALLDNRIYGEPPYSRHFSRSPEGICSACHMFVAYSQNKASCFTYPPGCQICAIYIFNDTRFHALAQKSDSPFECARLPSEHVKGAKKMGSTLMRFDAEVAGSICIRNLSVERYIRTHHARNHARGR
jgi:hypothetical protein